MHYLKLLQLKCVSPLSTIVSRASSSLNISHQIARFSTVPAFQNQKLMFTPGPVGVPYDTKAAMLRDLGSRDIEFMDTIKFIRRKVLDVANIPTDLFTMIPLQGSGTYSVEGTLQTMMPRHGGKLLLAVSGSYGLRMIRMAQYADIDTVVLRFNEDQKVDVKILEEALKADNGITHIGIVHCESSSGVVHPVEEAAEIARKILPNVTFFVDAMSSFGGVPIDFTNIDFLVTSANKCLEGCPGFGLVIARKDKLLECKGNCRSLALDVYEQYINFENTGQMRFTPPTHVMLAFKKALQCWEEEGGVEGRSKRYKENQRLLHEGMDKMGFEKFLSDEHTGYILTSYRFPNDRNFDFETFHTKLFDMGMVIYPGKKTEADCFRIGNIGNLHPEDIFELLVCIEKICIDMLVKLPL